MIISLVITFENEWLNARGLVNEKDGQGNTPIHLLSSYQISDFRFLLCWKVDMKAYNSENLTAYDIISTAKEDISKKKVKSPITSNIHECLIFCYETT